MTTNSGTEAQIADLAGLMKPCYTLSKDFRDIDGNELHYIKHPSGLEDFVHEVCKGTGEVPSYPELRVECIHGHSVDPERWPAEREHCSSCSGIRPRTLEEAEAVLDKMLVRLLALENFPGRRRIAFNEFRDSPEAPGRYSSAGYFTSGWGSSPTKAIIAALHASEVK